MIAITSAAHPDAAPLPPESVPHFIGIRTWEALGKGWPTSEWSKVHPDLRPADFQKQVAETTERVSVEVYRILESVHPK